MGRLIIFALIACAVLRMATGRWPWQLWQASQRSQDEAQARSLLGVSPKASRDDIAEAHRRLLIRVHPDKGGTNEAVHQANRAKDILLARIARHPAEQA
ncbi:MAG: DnaJ domain-containing protein [Novosphingobium sp.]